MSFGYSCYQSTHNTSVHRMQALPRKDESYNLDADEETLLALLGLDPCSLQDRIRT
jgi:hypothetical protein